MQHQGGPGCIVHTFSISISITPDTLRNLSDYARVVSGDNVVHELGHEFSFGLKPETALDSASVAHRLVSPLVLWLRLTLVLATSRMNNNNKKDTVGLVGAFIAAIVRDIFSALRVAASCGLHVSSLDM